MEQRSIDLCLAIKDAVAECLEKMVFMTVDTECDGLPPDQVCDEVIASIKILNPKSGELRLSMPRTTAAELAKALFCITEQEITEGLIGDLTCELLNTISGRVMKRVLPAECLYNLGLPTMAGRDLPQLPPSFVNCRFTADGNLLAVMASIEV